MFMSEAQMQDAFGHDLLSDPTSFHITGLTPEDQLRDLNDMDIGNMSHSLTAGSSPQLIDLLVPGTDMNRPPPPEELRPPDSPAGAYQPGLWVPHMDGINIDEEVEEIVRTSEPAMDSNGVPFGNRMSPSMWLMRASSPALSISSNSSSGSDKTMIPRPLSGSDTKEMIAIRFNEDTCGILSVKNGDMENPWRTMIWPLTQESEALSHAISSLTSFHISRESPDLRVQGIRHMMKSIKSLNVGLSNTRTDISLATTLVLAFAESWDQHISTGIQHLRGAKSLVKHALVSHQNQGASDLSQMPRLRFLINTWIYMDVIARLTSVTDDDNGDLEEILFSMSNPTETSEVDPLLGCAASLFPLIGSVASLIGMVRRTESNDLNIISRASELKTLLEQWQAPDHHLFENPDDKDSKVQHSIQTAEAYRYATLLYLHQAVPEIPSKHAGALAQDVLKLLATVPTTSRATIIHIYPLLAASCEARSDGDRKFCMDRWTAITSRLRIGNADKCVDVVKEVWRRRDAYEAEKAERLRMRERNRLGMAMPQPFLGNPGDKRKSLSSEDAVDMNAFLASGLPPGLDTFDGHFHSKRRALVGSGSRPIPGRVSALTNTPNMPGQAMGLMPTSMRNRSSDSPTENLDFEYTVRGHLHWVGVMNDWRWEILLG
ncbi:putative c6 finger domain-containing protein [Phaeomoniella chlamydospora]|uniref:Putative c6 finger domain-containing protein n=1 Tax=Phaeomoniella chlamydospora TaxID=158046 RepID=A0A0G2H189_PHACM|nr:putative c6 finger domain-containing protein [Phaeomoniella chlamydospora]